MLGWVKKQWRNGMEIRVGNNRAEKDPYITQEEYNYLINKNRWKFVKINPELHSGWKAINRLEKNIEEKGNINGVITKIDWLAKNNLIVFNKSRSTIENFKKQIEKVRILILI